MAVTLPRPVGRVTIFSYVDGMSFIGGRLPTFCVSGAWKSVTRPRVWRAWSVDVSHDALQAEIRSIAERVAESHGLELFDIGLRREPIGWVLRIVLDKSGDAADGGSSAEEEISVRDCERVSRDLSAILDVEVTFSHAYTLEVSSPGLDRPLRHLDDCQRFVGRLAKLVTTEAVDGQHAWTGRIAGVRGEDVVIEAADRSRQIPWPLVSRAKLEVEF